jgi:Cu-processing system permease protein
MPTRVALAVAGDILREAATRKWFLGLGVAITLAIAFFALVMRVEVVDGALAAWRFFGKPTGWNDIRSADVAVRPVFEAVAYVIYYGGLCFGIVSCSDFGPSLLSPGRIEHLLALPVRRWELLAGTYLGVLALAALGTLYGAGGVTVLLGFKTGVWTARPIVAALLATLAFAGVYGPMLTTAVYARSAALSTATGGLLFLLGLLASYRSVLADLFGDGIGRTLFEIAMLPWPRLAQLAEISGNVAASAHVGAGAVLRVASGVVLFGTASLMVGVWRFEKMDF